MRNLDQAEFAVRCEWGLAGLTRLAAVSDVVVIVDVLSFSTAVDIAVGDGAAVFPYPWKNPSAAQYAASVDAELASSERAPGSFSLAPDSLLRIPAGCRLVLPSPNGATLAWSADNPNTFTACLRNARAVAESAARLGATFAVIPAGEHWPDSGLRPCVEDLAGAGAVLSHLPGPKSPEAELAVQVFRGFERNLERALSQCGSGKELIERGFPADVSLAAQLNVSAHVPWLKERAFVDHPDRQAKRG